MLLMLGASANFIINALSTIFVSLLDWVAYGLVNIAYTIFLATANLDLFGSGSAGEQIFKDISSTIYTVMSVVVVFVFAYYLLTMIIDPEKGNGAKQSSSFIKDTAISIGAVILLPLIFNYMFIFQHHVLQDQTIPAIILGINPASGASDEGNSISLMTYVSLYHPENMTYSDFVDQNGKVKPSSTSCDNLTGDAEETCELFSSSLKSWEDDEKGYSNKIGYITSNYDLRKKIGVDGGMDYLWILATVCGVLVAWFFFSYAIDMGTRAVKLGCLQLIAPIPIMLRVFPKQKKTYDTWFSEIKKTYLEVFARIAVIFFIVRLISLVPSLIDVLFSPDSGLSGIAKPLTTVAIILGLLKFAKEVPDLFKSMFAGDLFKGVNFKPGAAKRIKDNELAMRGMAGASGLALGGISSGIRRGISAYKNMAPDPTTGKKAPFRLTRSIGTGIGSTFRGGIAGAKSGLTSKPKDFKELGTSVKTGIDTAHATADTPAWRRLHDAQEASKNGGSFVKEFVRPTVNDAKDKWKVLAGTNGNSSKTAQAANTATNALSQITTRFDNTVEGVKKASEDAVKDLMNKGTAQFYGQTYDASAFYDAIDLNKVETIGTQQVSIYKATGADGTTQYEVDADGYRVVKDSTGYHYQDAAGNIVSDKSQAQNIKSEVVAKGIKNFETKIKNSADEIKYEIFKKKWNEDVVKQSIKSQISNVNTYLNKHLTELGADNIKVLDSTVRQNCGDPSMNLERFMKEVMTTNEFSIDQVRTLVKLKTTFGNIEKNAKIAEAQEKQNKEDKK